MTIPASRPLREDLYTASPGKGFAFSQRERREAPRRDHFSRLVMIPRAVDPRAAGEEKHIRSPRGDHYSHNQLQALLSLGFLRVYPTPREMFGPVVEMV